MASEFLSGILSGQLVEQKVSGMRGLVVGRGGRWINYPYRPTGVADRKVWPPGTWCSHKVLTEMSWSNAWEQF